MCRSLDVCYLNDGSRGFYALSTSSHPQDVVNSWDFMQAAAGLCSGPEKALSAKLLPIRSGRCCAPHQGPSLPVPVLPWVLQPLAGSVCPTASRNMEATSKVRRLHRWPHQRSKGGP